MGVGQGVGAGASAGVGAGAGADRKRAALRLVGIEIENVFFAAEVHAIFRHPNLVSPPPPPPECV